MFSPQFHTTLGPSLRASQYISMHICPDSRQINVTKPMKPMETHTISLPRHGQMSGSNPGASCTPNVRSRGSPSAPGQACQSSPENEQDHVEH